MNIKGKISYFITAHATILALTLTLGVIQVHAQELQQSKQNKRPNILLIVADDMGYSDLGSYGVQQVVAA